MSDLLEEYSFIGENEHVTDGSEVLRQETAKALDCLSNARANILANKLFLRLNKPGKFTTDDVRYLRSLMTYEELQKGGMITLNREIAEKTANSRHIQVLDELIASGEKANPKHWELGGPYPATSVIYMVDGGHSGGWGECPEPPQYDLLAMLDERPEGMTPDPQARHDADFIVKAGNARNSLKYLVDEIKSLREKVAKLEHRAY